ncbi:YqcI/YcgG family protein [Streptomyces sp. NPDC020965]|uniref:YqcI/YcgG family protein n=1 Tax=Streptomyces sp. NPDC020965 TaxID=3365105 RepID=UPI0037AA0FEF
MLSADILPADGSLTSQVIGDIPEWGVTSATELIGKLTSSTTPFPCTFAVSAAKKSSLRFGFIEDLNDQQSWEALPGIIASYLETYQTISRETSLIVIFRPDPETGDVAHYYRKFWDVLQYLHRNDPEPWPADIPESPDDGRWEFSFAGTPIFVVCNTPAHKRRASRSNASFMITFQPRWVFEELDANTARGAAARRVIRKRLRAFDEEEPSPELGSYGDPGNREWRQYYLPDDNVMTPGRCPFHHETRDRVPAARGEGIGD